MVLTVCMCCILYFWNSVCILILLTNLNMKSVIFDVKIFLQIQIYRKHSLYLHKIYVFAVHDPPPANIFSVFIIQNQMFETGANQQDFVTSFVTTLQEWKCNLSRNCGYRLMQFCGPGCLLGIRSILVRLVHRSLVITSCHLSFPNDQSLKH